MQYLKKLMEAVTTFTKNHFIKIQLGVLIAILFSVIRLTYAFANFEDRIDDLEYNQQVRIEAMTIEKANTMYDKLTQIEQNKDDVIMCRNNFDTLNGKVDLIIDGLGLKYRPQNEISR